MLRVELALGRSTSGYACREIFVVLAVIAGK